MPTIYEQVAEANSKVVALEATNASLKAELTTTNASIKAITDERAAEKARLTELEQKFQAFSIQSKSSDGPTHSFDMGKAVNAIYLQKMGEGSNAWRNAKQEQKIMADERDRVRNQKAVMGGTDVLGDFLVPEEYLGSRLIGKLGSRTVMLEAGATNIPVSGNPVRIPKETGQPTAYYVGQGSPITASNSTIGQVTANAHKCAALVKLDAQLVKLASPAIQPLITKGALRQIARRRDLSAISGTGADNAPLGLFGLPSSLASSPTSDTILLPATLAATLDGASSQGGYDALVNLMNVVEEQDGLIGDGSEAFIINPRNKGRLMKMKDANGRPMLQQDPTKPTQMMLFGYPVYVTTLITNALDGANTSRVIFGSMSQLGFCSWGSYEIAVSVEAGDSYANDEVWVRILELHDWVWTRLESFSYLKCNS